MEKLFVAFVIASSLLAAASISMHMGSKGKSALYFGIHIIF